MNLSARVLILAGLLAPRAAAEDAVAVADWFPVKEGYRWEFAVTKRQRVVLPGRPEHEQSVSEKVVDHIAATSPMIEVVSTREVASAQGTRTGTLRSRITVDAEGIRVHAQTLDLGTDDPPQTSTQEAPLLLAPARVRPGDRWAMGTMRIGGLRLELRGEALGFETVTTPAGTFERCLKIANRGTSSGTMTVRGQAVEIEEGTIAETIWLAPGIGEVQQDGISDHEDEAAGRRRGAGPVNGYFRGGPPRRGRGMTPVRAVETTTVALLATSPYVSFSNKRNS